MKYDVTITETIQKTITLEADNAEQAKAIAREKYKNEADGFVLTADDYTETDFTVELGAVEEYSYKDRIAAASVAKKIL